MLDFEGVRPPKKIWKKIWSGPNRMAEKSSDSFAVHLIVGKVSFWRGTHDSRLMVVLVKSEQFFEMMSLGETHLY